MDRIGPLPESYSGNKFILVIIDCFTRWITLYPVKDGTMEGARSALLWHIGHTITPLEVVHDGGTEFTNGTITELFAMCGIRNTKTLAYSKEENSIVERANKEVMRHLRNVLFQTNITTNWEDHLGTIMRIMNNQKRGSNFPSPASLLFGSSHATDEDLFLPVDAAFAEETQHELSEWATNMIVQQTALLEAASAIQRDKDMAHIGKQGIARTEYANDSYVLAKYHSTDGVVRHRGPPNKFLANLRGPFRVISHSEDTYTIRSLITTKDEKIHVKELREFIHPLPVDEDALRDIARRDHQDTYAIGHVYDHQGPEFSRTKMKFRVHWQGYSAEEDTWTEYKHLRDSAALHTYLLARPEKGFQRMVPKKFFHLGVYTPEPN